MYGTRMDSIMEKSAGLCQSVVVLRAVVCQTYQLGDNGEDWQLLIHVHATCIAYYI